MIKGSIMSLEQRKRVSEGRKGIGAWNKNRRKIPFTSKYCLACSRIYLRYPDSSDILWLRRRFCSKSCALVGNKRTMGMFLGSKNAAWRGGITSENMRIRSSTPMNE